MPQFSITFLNKFPKCPKDETEFYCEKMHDHFDSFRNKIVPLEEFVIEFHNFEKQYFATHPVPIEIMEMTSLKEERRLNALFTLTK